MMKYLLLLPAIFALATISATGQDLNPDYDSTLAKELGADEYGMKWYVLAILKTGEHDMEKGPVRDSLFAGHFENMKRMADDGKLFVAGPLAENEKTYRGIFVLNVTSFEEANALLQTDPTIKEHVLDVELYKWYGSAALPEYLEIHEKIGKFLIK